MNKNINMNICIYISTKKKKINQFQCVYGDILYNTVKTGSDFQ